MENRRSEGPGRRQEDRRWLKLQEQVMDLVKEELAKIEIEVVKLSDHVEAVDDHLRGVEGRDSIDTRVALLEKEFEMHGVLLRQISAQCGSFVTTLQEVRTDLHSMKIAKAMTEKVESTKFERFKEWLTLGRAVILALIALVVPLATLIVTEWDKIAPVFHYQHQTAEQIQKEIELQKKGPRGKAVRKKLAEIEKEAQEMRE